MELTKTDEGCTLKKSEHCYAVWKKKRRCENCISQEVLRTHKPQTKIETRASDIYYVLASFIEVDGRPYSLELVKRTKSDDMFERENVLNQLLVRDRHTVALTPAGQTLLTGAEDLLRQADALAAAVHTAAEAAPELPEPPEA